MKFLEYFKSPVFQTFKDRPDAGGYAKIFLEYDEAEFRKLNKVGCGIYFTPNGFRGGRKLENLTSINAAFADLDVCKETDNISDEEKTERRTRITKALLSDRITPNFVLNTKNGVQPIWILEGAENNAETRKNWTWLIKGIIEWSKQYGCAGDEVKDLTRVIRFPGYYHMKGDPYMVTVQEYSDEKYPIWFMREAFPYEPPKEKKVEPPKYKKGDVANEIDRIDFQDLVIRAFASVGRTASFDDKKRLILDGRLTGTYQGKTGDGNFLASSSHEPFQGNRITVVSDILGVTNKEAFRWIKEEYGIGDIVRGRKAEKVVKEVLAESEVVADIDTEAKVFTWGTEGLNSGISPIQQHHFIIVAGDTGAGKTTFCFDVAWKNAIEGKKVLFLSLEMTGNEIYNRLARGFASIKKSEWRNRKTIVDSKKEAYHKRIREVKSLKNLILRGMAGVEATVENIFEIIKSVSPDVVFIDNFDLIQKDSGVSEYNEQNRVAKELMDFPKKNNIPLIVLHHKKKGKEVGIDSIRGSGKITHNCDSALICSRTYDVDATPMENSMFVVRQEKDRDFGQMSLCNVYFKKGSFYDNY